MPPLNLQPLYQHACQFTQKTNVLVVGRDAEAQASNVNISIRGDTLEGVSFFKYLGSILLLMLQLTLKSVIGLLQPMLLLFVYARPKFGPHGLCHVSPNCSFFSLLSFQF